MRALVEGFRELLGLVNEINNELPGGQRSNTDARDRQACADEPDARAHAARRLLAFARLAAHRGDRLQLPAARTLAARSDINNMGDMGLFIPQQIFEDSTELEITTGFDLNQILMIVLIVIVVVLVIRYIMAKKKSEDNRN